MPNIPSQFKLLFGPWRSDMMLKFEYTWAGWGGEFTVKSHFKGTSQYSFEVTGRPKLCRI